MASLPTAYASQVFGRKTLDFYAAGGEVNGADPRARADERRLTDVDGARHTVRLTDKDFALEPGDQASVLRLQPGPARRSRPVAVVNHSRNGWCRTHPGASALLSRAGVARNVNWLLTLVLMALASMVMIWPYLRAFLVEVDPGLFSAAPDLNVFELTLAALPDLASWSFSDTVAPLSGLIAQLAPGLADQADALVFLLATGIGGALVFAVRSWRLLWAPLFVGVVGAAALSLGGVEAAAGHAISGFALTSVIFLIGGVINRVRDSARLERRIALLADHLLRHAPDEVVRRTEDEETPADDTSVDTADDTADDAVAAEDKPAPLAAATPVAAAVALSPTEGDADGVEAEPVQDADTVEDGAATAESEPASTSPDDAETQAQATATEEAEESPASETSEAPLANETTQDTEADTAAPNEDDSADEMDAQTDADAEDAEDADDDAADLEAASVQSDTNRTPEVALEAGSESPSDAQDETEAPNPASAVLDATPVESEAVNSDADETDSEVEPDAEVETAEGAAETQSEREADAPETSLSEAEKGSETPSESALDADASTDAPEAELELAGLDPEEAERLKTDPRYAARAIVLPQPPPMPAPVEPVADTAVAPNGPQTGATRELRPQKPLSATVVPIFAAPPAPPAPPVPPASGADTED